MKDRSYTLNIKETEEETESKENHSQHMSVFVSSCVWLLQKDGHSSSGCCSVQARSQWRSSWGASLASPSLFLPLVSCGPLHQSSTTLCGAVEGSSSSPSELPCCAAPPSDHHDFGLVAWTHLFSYQPSLPSHFLNPCMVFSLACSPSLTHRYNHARSPSWEERHLCPYTFDCRGGQLLQSDLCSHWTD